jgi:transketolase
MTLEEKCINTIRCLAIDAVQKANSGHPGTPVALAPAAFVLWNRHLKFNPANPKWFNRDRFVLSNGHASMLQYAMLHLTGYGITLEDIKNFRQWDSITPGHPEFGITPGIETTTGPLGQGIMTAVGMAMAEAHLAAKFNKELKIIDHATYVFCSDGDLMEGASHEAASLAGHLGLGKLICLFDNNHITIDGTTAISCTDDIAKRFESYHWHVQDLGDKGNDLEAISKAFENAKAATDKPSLIMLRTHIGYGSPNKQDSPEAHGSPFGEEEVKLTKRFYQWPEDEKFLVPEDVKTYMNKAVESGSALENEWNKLQEKYKTSYPKLHQQLEQQLNLAMPENWATTNFPVYKTEDKPVATREVTAKVIMSISESLPWLVGGSGDLDASTLTMIKSSGYFGKGQYENRNFAWGIREHLMCAASSGIYLHGGLRAFAATFFIFSDYARAAIRMASIMKLPVIYVMTHDSIGLGEDGTTHQPIEHLASFRAMPHICVIRPADANEAVHAWYAAIRRTEGPTMLVLTRQKLPVIDRSKNAGAEGVNKGAYILSKETGNQLDLLLIATGSEVHLILEAQSKLMEEGMYARVISMPSWELFRAQSQEYRDEVLPPSVRNRIAVEAASPQGWSEWVGDEGKVIAIDKFGSSAPAKELFKHYGITVENIVVTAHKSFKKT